MEKYNHDRPLEDFEEQIKILRESGFNPIGVSQMYFEDTFIFKTAKEAKEAYHVLERTEDDLWIGECVGWYYSKRDFMKEVKDYEKKIGDEEPVRVLVHWL